MKRILTIFGTRPEAIKMAPVVRELQRRAEVLTSITCVTAQHRELLDQVLLDFALIPDVDLDLMEPGQDLYDITSRVLVQLRDVLKQVKPDMVLVHGDTTTAMAAALAAFYQEIPVGHVEAGLRTFCLSAPFPEEMNRQVVGRLATLHFAPTVRNRANLIRENLPQERIHVTGNTVIDALLYMKERILHDPDVHARVAKKIADLGLSSPGRNGEHLVLVTGHRRENFGKGFDDICTALADLVTRRNDIRIIFPVHLNPHVKSVVERRLGRHQHVQLVPPLDYETFIWLMHQSKLILTDSGGIQEEGPALGKPVLVMRETTERPEGVEAGTVRLVGTEPKAIVDGVLCLLDDPEAYSAMACAVNPYGDGQAAQRICDAIEIFFGLRKRVR